VGKLSLITMQHKNSALHIAEDDMIHITWKHMTVRINVTGLICLVDFLNGNPRLRTVGFEVFGNMDDGYEIWIQDVGIRLTASETADFKELLVDGLEMLRKMGKDGTSNHLPNMFKLTTRMNSTNPFSSN